MIDLDDSVLRRKRGENNYFSALKSDLLPRATHGQFASVPRREQKIRLAKLLFSDGEEVDEESNPSEVYVDNVDGNEDPVVKKRREERLRSAKFALRLSTVLREPACSSLSLSEISKRYINLYGKEHADVALRCAEKAIEVASEGLYDSDDIAMEGEEEAKVDPKFEKNATYPGLAHPTTLKLQPRRVSVLCLRSAYLHRGNALAAQGREDDARASYQAVLPMIKDEPRCTRVDWERSSLYVNIGNTFSRQGDYEKANEQYNVAEKLGTDHMEAEQSNRTDGMGIKIVAMRARAFALKKAGKEDEGKKQLREVLSLQMELNQALEKQKAEQKAMEAAAASTAGEPGQLIAESS